MEFVKTWEGRKALRVKGGAKRREGRNRE